MFAANCRTTAMGIMPHTNIDKALRLAMGLDIPFWPQLPNVNYYEDMYVQASQHFPGIVVDVENKKMHLDQAKFQEELLTYSEKMTDPATFTLDPAYSVVYHRFLIEELSKYAAIRGQYIGPVSFGFRVTDETNKPIIYDDVIRPLLFDFIQKKVNVQVQELRKRNGNAFVWMDEPGLGWVFSGLSGYSDVSAAGEYRTFLSGIEGLKALHLCANVNLPYLLDLGDDLLSFDAYQMKLMPREYAKAVAKFLNKGGIISWGIVPTDSESLDDITPERIAQQLLEYWEVVAASGLTLKQIAGQALIAPASCCLKNIGRVGASGESSSCPLPGDMTSEEQVVEMAFDWLKKVSVLLKESAGLE